jgi:hypothetical protein
MTDTETIRARIWNILGTAQEHGHMVVRLVTLMPILKVSGLVIMAALKADMIDTPAGFDSPPLRLLGTDEGPAFYPRRFPA